MTIILAWWMLPVAFVLVGLIGGFIIASLPESGGYFAWNGPLGFLWFVAWAIAAGCVCIGKALA